MKAKTLRYLKVARQYGSTRDQILHLADMSRDEYYHAEFEAGLALIENYFQDMDPGIVYHLRKLLVYRRKHGYWLWFINQKQQTEMGFKNQYLALVDHAETDPRHFRSEYLYALRDMGHSDKIHDRLRAFIVQSKTIYL